VKAPLLPLDILLVIALLGACSRPTPTLIIDPADSADSADPTGKDTGARLDSGQSGDSSEPTDSGDTGAGADSGDTEDTGEPASPSDQDMIKAFFGPMMLTEGAHTYSHPDDLVLLGFNSLDMSQYVLLGPDGVVSTQYSEQEITDRLNRFKGTGLEISLTFIGGYTSSGDEADAVWGSQYADEGADIEMVLGHLTDHMVAMVPMAEELEITQISVYKPDLLFYEKTNDDGSPNFDAVSAWSQTHLAAMEAAGWGDEDNEQLIWKFGYDYVPPTASESNIPIDIDFSGYDGAGFSLSAADASWESDAEVWAALYRDQVDRFLVHFAGSLPEASGWPAITELGVADASCGYWSSPDEVCEIYWTEEHIMAAFDAVLTGVSEWNSTEDEDFRGVYILDSPSDSGMFSIGESQNVRTVIEEGLAALE
jgi:hypothetical protein